jgi:flagellar hook protein FlgE
MTGDGTTEGSGVSIQANLDSGSTLETSFDVANAIGTSNFDTTITIYDSLGQDHPLHVYFNKVAENSWQWHAVVDGGELQGGTAGTAVQVADGTLTFNASGALQSAATNSSSANFTGTPQVIGFNFGDPIDDGGTGLGGVTQFAGASIVNAQSQDGLPAGNLVSVSVEADGTVAGLFSNGRTIPIGQVALATFPAVEGLVKVGAGMYQETLASGQPAVGQPDSGSLGTVAAYSLEMSNVDLAKEFVDMIQIQRAYQANSRTITVGDQLLSELINLVR